jgi:hypothetical protein
MPITSISRSPSTLSAAGPRKGAAAAADNDKEEDEEEDEDEDEDELLLLDELLLDELLLDELLLLLLGAAAAGASACSSSRARLRWRVSMGAQPLRRVPSTQTSPSLSRKR